MSSYSSTGLYWWCLWNLEDYNPTKKRKVLRVFEDMKTDMEADKKLSSIVTELFIRGQKLNILFVFVSQSYFKVPKTIRLNATNYFFMKIPNKREIQQIASNHSCDIEFKDFVKVYMNYTKEPFSFSVNDTTSASGNPFRFRENLL